MIKFRGTGVAVVTPFDGGKVDYVTLGRMIEHLLAGGVDYIVSLGSTGEAIALTREECREVLRFMVRQVNGRVPLVAGLFGANSTAHLLERLRAYTTELEGFDAIMSSTPSYVKPTQEGVFQHYMAVAEKTPLPIILYNVPARTASNLTAATALRLASVSEKFIAIKEASGNLQQVQQLIKNRPAHFLVLSGDDPLTLAMLGCGADGAISVIANAFPKIFSNMVRAALRNNFEEARHLHYQLFDLHPLLYVEGNPAGIKAVLATMGLCKNELRLPLVPVSSDTYREIKNRILENKK